MDYLILFIALALTSATFSINKIYQKKYTGGLRDIFFYSFVSGISNIVFFILLGLGLYGRLPEFSVFSLVMATALAVVSTLSVLVGLIIMKYGPMSVYSVFMMLGGMILPYLFGLTFLDETISPARVVGILVLICALPFSAASPAKKSEAEAKKTVSSKFYYILCIFIFLLNGATSIISKTHSVNVSAVPAASFIVYANIWGVLINGAAYFIFAPRMIKSEKSENADKQGAKPSKLNAILTIVICSVVGGIGSLIFLTSAKTVPAVVLYPFITGGIIVLNTVCARIFFKEKIGKLAAAGVAMSFAGTLLFLF